MQKNVSPKLVSLIFGISVILFATAFYTFADWQPPADSAPYCTAGDPGCDMPINTSLNSQLKQGALEVNGLKNLGTTDVDGNRIINVATPQAGTDAVNRDYVDGLGGGGGSSDYPALVMTTSEFNSINTAVNDKKIKFTTAKYSWYDLLSKGVAYVNQICALEFGSYHMCDAGTQMTGATAPDGKIYYSNTAGGTYTTNLSTIGYMAYSSSYDGTTMYPAGVSVTISSPADCSSGGYPWVLCQSTNNFIVSGSSAYTCVATCGSTKSVIYKFGSNLFMSKNTFAFDYGSAYKTPNRSLSCCPN